MKDFKEKLNSVPFKIVHVVISSFESSHTQIVTIETMLGKEEQQADGTQNGDCEKYFLPFDRLTLLCIERLAGIQYAIQFNRSEHIA